MIRTFRSARGQSLISCLPLAARLIPAAIGALAGQASATWSIVICDTRTGEVAVASATCLTGFDLQANTPVMIIGVGGATAQSSVDQGATNRTFIRDHMYAGDAPVDILAGLSVFDSAHQSRQYGMADTLGRTVTFSGTGAGQWKGGKTGQAGDLVYAVQGNVLWGPLVVDKAVEAIINTPGDVPAKMMAAMEAARSQGGDGRCSCSPANPSGCTSLPDTFKSAHVAYMLIGRAGDRDGSNGNYKSGTYSTALATGEFTSDGRNDVVAVGSGGVAVFPGAAQTGQAPMLGDPIPTPVPGASLRDIQTADFNSDGKADVVVTDNPNDAVLVLMGHGDGTFDPPVSYPAGDAPQLVVTGDFNGDHKPDVACTSTNTGAVLTFLNNGDGTMGLPAVINAGSGPQVFTPADADGDGDNDLPVGSTGSKSLTIYKNNGSGGFSSGATTVFTVAVNSVDTADLNADGRPDMLVTFSSGSNINILLQQPDGTYEVHTISIGGTPGTGLLRDLTGDGVLDIVVPQRGQSRLYVLAGQGDGKFDDPKFYPIGFSPTTMRLADMDGDGDLDPVLRVSSGLICLMMHAGGGVFGSESGLAGGDYFMDYNIANQSTTSVDPVVQIESQFAAVRAGLIGKPDAVQSLASFDPPLIHADGQSQTTLHIHALDWQHAHVPLDNAGVSIALSGDDVATAGPPVHEADGTVSVPVIAKQACGAATFEITITGIGRKVVLMPRLSLTVSDPSDFDNSGSVDTNDYDAFVNAFIQGGDDSDFDHSGWVDTDDFTAFVLRFGDAC